MKSFIFKGLLLALAAMALPLAAQSFSPKSQSQSSQVVRERILWGVPISPYVRVALVTLNEKKLSYTHKKSFPTVLLKAMQLEVDPAFTRSSPFGKVPAYAETYVDGTQFGLAESMVIADYINDTEKSPALRPADPRANALVSFFMAYGSNTLAPATHALVFENVVKPGILKEAPDVDKIERILQIELPPMLDYLESTLSDERTWLANTNHFSLADIVVVSHLATLNSTNLPGLSAESAIGKDRPHLLSYYRKVVARESFQKALQE